MDAGALLLLGPATGQEATCIAGRPCEVAESARAHRCYSIFSVICILFLSVFNDVHPYWREFLMMCTHIMVHHLMVRYI